MSLKDFQIATVKTALRYLRDPSGSRRFLVADEVGLGKTLVAQGVIKGLCRKGEHKSVFYICSSLTIAHQNQANLLEVLDEKEREHARVEVDRLTLLPKRVPSEDAPFTLYTLTPGTMPSRKGNRRGRTDERAVIAVLVGMVVDYVRRSDSVFLRHMSCGVKEDNWKYALQEARAALAEHPEELLNRLTQNFTKHLLPHFSMSRGSDPSQLGQAIVKMLDDDRGEAIFRLRNALSLAALENLRPDLVILDEFQRFFEAVIPDEPDLDVDESQASPDPADEVADKPDVVAQDLMGRLLNMEASGKSPAILMLSATPYRMYSRWEEGSANHYQELNKLLKFLLGPNRATELSALTSLFRDYAKRLEFDPPGSREVLAVKEEICKLLRPAIARTERVAILRDYKDPKPPELKSGQLFASDVRTFRHLSDSAPEEYRWMAVPIWGSIPFPLQMMDERYVLRKQAQPAYALGKQNELKANRVQTFSPLPLAHPRLRALMGDLPGEFLRLPWMPPTKPWWTLGREFAAAGERSKMLIFSHYRAVPRALAASLSYVTERDIFTAVRERGKEEVGYDYFKRSRGKRAADEPDRSKSKLRPQPSPSFAVSESRADLRFNTIVMFFPLPGLALAGDPMRLKGFEGGLTWDSAKREVVARLKSVLGVSSSRGRVHEVWRWAITYEARTRHWLGLKKLWSDWLASESSEGPAREAAAAFLGEAAFPRDRSPNAEELDQLAEIALAGPGQVVFRAANRVFGEGEGTPRQRFSNVIEISMSGLSRYLDQPDFHVAFARDGGREHPANVRRVVWDGNLESVLDEFFVYQQGLGLKAPPAGRESRAFESLLQALKIRAASIDVRPTVTRRDRGGKFKLRAHVAMPFGLSANELPDEEGGPLRSDHLRVAFNSPFRPFVLVSTSIGQEGLDFHVYCDHIVHWDLPGNPVDLEQREGRVQRFGGLAVRRAMAKKAGKMRVGDSPWRKIGTQQKESAGGLVPWWGMEGVNIRRSLYHAEMSRQVDDLERLSKELSIYRLALGQANQEDLLKALKRRIEDASEDERKALHDWFASARIQLSPFMTESEE